jgi:2-keto-4-pentenoate hydratase/2-oxohepta-3-ene-1,7-dioic acid hydratase in catechol pathway
MWALIIRTIQRGKDGSAYSVPVMFSKLRSALIGHFPDTVNIPKCAADWTSDYEAELCIIIGKTGRHVSEEEALDYVLGYTASNDILVPVLCS